MTPLLVKPGVVGDMTVEQRGGIDGSDGGPMVLEAASVEMRRRWKPVEATRSAPIDLNGGRHRERGLDRRHRERGEWSLTGKNGKEGKWRRMKMKTRVIRIFWNNLKDKI